MRVELTKADIVEIRLQIVKDMKKLIREEGLLREIIRQEIGRVNDEEFKSYVRQYQFQKSKD